MLIEISNGEMVDKVSILEIKSQKIKSKEKIKNIKGEYSYLKQKMILLGITNQSKEYKNLLKVNLIIWDLEEKIRSIEKERKFDKEFINLARLIYLNNDKRAMLKRKINEQTNSLFIEEKELPNYK